VATCATGLRVERAPRQGIRETWPNVSPMTPRERLLRAFRIQEVDRFPIHIRGVRPWDEEWVASRHPSYARLVEAVRDLCDWCAAVGFGDMPFLTAHHVPVETRVTSGPDWELHETTYQTPLGPLHFSYNVSAGGHPGMTKEFLVKTGEDVRRLLSIPYERLRPDIAPYRELESKVGERGIVLASFPNPLGHVHDCLGSQLLALWSMTDRHLILELLEAFAERVSDLVSYLLDRGVRLFATAGHEYAGPPLLSPADFREFCTRVERPIVQRIRERGGLLHIHCHGPMRAILDEFLEIGANCLHPVEPPPMGDITLAQAKKRIGHAICIEGNIQIGEIYSAEREEVIALAKAAIRDGSPGGGFILCPSASPYTPELTDRALTNYLAMIETGLREGER